jgi:hypothetical protein
VSSQKAIKRHACPCSWKSSQTVKCSFPEKHLGSLSSKNELLAFPYGRYDDQVDALVQGLAHKRPSYLWEDEDDTSTGGMPLIVGI